MLAELVPIERVERTNIDVVHPNQWIEFVPKQDLYVIDMDKGKNCYNYRGSDHIVRYCRKKRNWKRVRQGKRVEYRNNRNNNLNREENLIVLD